MKKTCKHEMFKFMSLQELIRCNEAMIQLDSWDMANMENLQQWDMILDEIDFRSEAVVI